jgi:signal peptidase I
VSVLFPALLAALGALAIAGCGGASPKATGPSANAGAAIPASGSGASVTASTAPSSAAAHGGTAANAAAHGSPPDGSKDPHGAGSGGAGASPQGGGGSHSPGGSGTGGGAHHYAAVANGGAKAVSHAHSGASRKAPTLAPAANVPGGGAPSAQTGVPYEVSSISMHPNYQPETTVYYNPARTQPQIGEVVIFYLPTGAQNGSCGTVEVGGAPCDIPVPGITKTLAMKRVVGLPGDTIAIHDGHVTRNGQPEPEPQTEECKEEEEGCNYLKPVVVPAGDYYVMGDNRRLPQEDSRVFGAIPQAAIVGTVEGG